jgi:hypothetical protein
VIRSGFKTTCAHLGQPPVGVLVASIKKSVVSGRRGKSVACYLRNGYGS